MAAAPEATDNWAKPILAHIASSLGLSYEEVQRDFVALEWSLSRAATLAAYRAWKFPKATF